MHTAAPTGADPSSVSAGMACSSSGGWVQLVGGVLLVLLCGVYAFGFQMLGLMELSLANPFASLVRSQLQRR